MDGKKLVFSVRPFPLNMIYFHVFHQDIIRSKILKMSEKHT